MKNTELKTAGARIRYIRKLLNLNQNDFAKSLKVSNKTMSDVEQSKARPNFDLLVLLRKSHGVNLDYVALGTGQPFIEDNNLMIKRGQGFIEHEELRVNVELKTMLHYTLESEFVRLQLLDFFSSLYRRESEALEKDVKLDKKSQ